MRLVWGVLAMAACSQACACAEDEACPDTRWPTLVGAQYTFVRQHQSRLDSPYEGRLSLDPNGDTEQTHTIGFYFGWAMTSWAQAYFDLEKFMGAGVSGSVGLGGLTNGDGVREGAAGLPKVFYIARQYVRLMLPRAAGAARGGAARGRRGGGGADARRGGEGG